LGNPTQAKIWLEWATINLQLLALLAGQPKAAVHMFLL
jgi:hypothetical protein